MTISPESGEKKPSIRLFARVSNLFYLFALPDNIALACGALSARIVLGISTQENVFMKADSGERWPGYSWPQ
jgi:hypothetical protein